MIVDQVVVLTAVVTALISAEADVVVVSVAAEIDSAVADDQHVTVITQKAAVTAAVDSVVVVMDLHLKTVLQRGMPMGQVNVPHSLRALTLHLERNARNSHLERNDLTLHHVVIVLISIAAVIARNVRNHRAVLIFRVIVRTALNDLRENSMRVQTHVFQATVQHQAQQLTAVQQTVNQQVRVLTMDQRLSVVQAVVGKIAHVAAVMKATRIN